MASNKIYGNPTVTPINVTKVTVDQTYNPESENAQSGKAVEEAIDKAISEIEVSGGGKDIAASITDNIFCLELINSVYKATIENNILVLS
jgi:predicted transcriptional regulator